MADERRDNPVVLSRIYTRTGDDGTTALVDGARVAKTDSRLAAYADTDEANCAIGMAVTLGQLPADMTAQLGRIQNEQFDVGADLANPVSAEPPAHPPPRAAEGRPAAREPPCDPNKRARPGLRRLGLPGGPPGAALRHTARAVPRRAERSAWAAVRDHGESVSVWPAKYLNRLSDLLFILARVANAERGDVLWRPGGDR